MEVSKVKRNLLAACILSCLFAGTLATPAIASTNEAEAHLSDSQLKKMAREARTADQFTALAHYYDQRQNEYSKKAAEEKAEWDRRSHFTESVEVKYPRPADSSRYRYEYFLSKASEAATLSAKYSQAAANAGK